MTNLFENTVAENVFGRRRFFRHAASAAGGCVLLSGRVMEAVGRGARAENCIFILMAGGPSHTDTFDLKEGPWLPRSFQPARFGDLLFPRGLFPNLAERLGSIALVRSVRSRTLVHALAQARLPAFAPVFVAVNASRGKVQTDAELRGFDNLGPAMAAATPPIEPPPPERDRYGNTMLGDACIAARNLVRKGLRARVIQITSTGWDNHAGIYTGALNPARPDSLARQFDTAVARLIGDLALDGLLNQTLLLAMGEFGRTAGPLNSSAGRDHFPRQAVMVAGAGIRGPKVIGVTDRDGRATVASGWSRRRDIRPEDIQATIYSALGIDWAAVRPDSPSDSGFEYPPFSAQDECGPIHELWR